MGEEVSFTVEEGTYRLDSCIFSELQEMIPSRTMASKLIDDGMVKVNGITVTKNSAKVKTGDEVTVEIPEPEDVSIVPEDIPLDIVYEDSDIIVINKPRGMVVHPASGVYSGTLVNALLYHCTDLSGIGGAIRPGIVHRIDRDTTGLIVAAKNDRAHIGLASQLADHSMHRIYVCVLEGIVKNDSGRIEANIGRSTKDRKKMAVTDKNHGKEAVTNYYVLDRNYETNTTLALMRLETGRTHQIRVHMAYFRHPVAGDPVYGYKNTRNMAGQALHAWKLVLNHPSDGRKMYFTSEIPEDFRKLLKSCRLKNPEDCETDCFIV